MNNQRNRIRTKSAGFSALEFVVGLGISTAVVAGAATLMTSTASSWKKGQSWIDSDDGTRKAVSMMSRELRSALKVTIQDSGSKVVYRLPKMDASGDYVQPMQWDGVERSFHYANGKLYKTDPGGTRVVADKVWAVDPYMARGNGKSQAFNTYVGHEMAAGPKYKMFSSTGTGNLRELTIMLVTGEAGQRDNVVMGRKRERVFLRNAGAPVVTANVTPGGSGTTPDVTTGGDWNEDPGNPPPPKPPAPPKPKPPTSGGSSGSSGGSTPKPPTTPQPPAPPKPPEHPKPKKPIAAF